MADISDIEAALVAAVAAGFGLGDDYSPTTFGTSDLLVGSTPVVLAVGRGFPVSGDLEPALKAGKAVITVYPEPNWSKPGVRFMGGSKTVATTPITINTSVSGAAVTFSGTGTPGQVVGIGWNHTGYALRLTASETASAIAAAFAAMISGSTVSGSTVTLPNDTHVFASVVGDSTSQEEIRRQSQCFRLTLWAHDHKVRDIVGSRLTSVMSEVRSLALSDGSLTGLPIYRGITVDDQTQKTGVWKRSERYEVEYPTVKTEIVPGILFLGLNTNVNLVYGSFHPDGPYVSG